MVNVNELPRNSTVIASPLRSVADAKQSQLFLYYPRMLRLPLYYQIMNTGSGIPRNDTFGFLKCNLDFCAV
jgi:hypothetical protein